MKYKNNRKELDERLRFITARVGFTSENEIIKNLAILSDDFLAQKEDRKECKHELGDKEEHDHLGTYHITGDTCVKCGKHIMDWDNSTPSPLEGFKEIDDIDWVTPAISKVELAKKFNWLNRNQKKLYQYIKSLKEKK